MSGDLRGRKALVIPNDAITPFALAVPQAELEDLNRRIDQIRASYSPEGRLGRLPTACIAAMMILPHGPAGSGAKKLKAANHVEQRNQS
jgi:hypothetical protein